MNINTNLKEMRKQKNITQKEIAQITGIPYANYNKYETTQTLPDIITLEKLANFYNVTIDYLVGRDFKNELGYLNDTEIELVKTFKELKPLNQIKIIAEIKGMLIAQN